MKTAILFFHSSDRDFDGEYYGQVVNAFKSGGIYVDTVEILSKTDDLVFRQRLDRLTNEVDNLVIIDGENHAFDLKEKIAEKLDTSLVENENARTFLDAVCKHDGIEYSSSYALLPIGATLIPNIRGAYQGFILDENELTVIVLPANYKQFKVMCDKYVLPYLENKYGIKSSRLVLKYFGELNALKITLEQAQNVYPEQFVWNLYEKYGDVTVDLLFPQGEDSGKSNEVVRFIVGRHKENIYAEFDTTLSERLFDILKLKKLKISVAESFTGGRIISSLIQNSGASECVYEGAVTYSSQSKVKRLGVKEEDIRTKGAVSSVVAYRMAAGLLSGGNCDVALSTTGIAGPKSDDSNFPVGLCYIAVGMKDGVHTYKYNFTGNREEITETAKNTALFLAIKKLKNI